MNFFCTKDMTTTEQSYSKLEISKLKNTQEIIPEPVGHKKIVLLMQRLSPKFKMNTFNYMTASELFTNLLVDNPKVNFSSSFLEYAKHLKGIIDDVKANHGGEDVIRIFGLNALENWGSIDARLHLLDIASDSGIFWEYVVWDCPFVIGMLASIQNNDDKTLMDYITFYRCLEPECAIYIYEHLIRYAFDYRRLSMIGTIITAFTPYLMREDIIHKMGDLTASLMKYFSENYRTMNFRAVVDDDADFVKTVEILESYFPDFYKYFQIDWTSYMYYLVKTDNMDKLVELASKLEHPYQLPEYEIVLYSIAKKKDGITAVLLNGFEWHDRRDDLEKSRFKDYKRHDLEKLLCYLLQNMENSKSKIEAGFDPSFTGLKNRMYRESESGLNQIYNMHEKRFHMNIYVKSISARQFVMGEWCGRTNEPPESVFQCIFNDVNERADFNEGIEKQIITKLNRSLKSINRYHQIHTDVPVLIDEFMGMCQVMYQFQQYENNDVKVI